MAAYGSLRMQFYGAFVRDCSMADSSAAVLSIVDTVLLAPRFALVVVVGPDTRPQLTQRTLAWQLEAAGLEVLWHTLTAEGSLLSEVVEHARTERPVVMLSEIEHLASAEREELLVRLNLQRDAVGELPVRVIYWCSHRGLDELRRFAPDLLHWRALLQALTPADLLISDWRTYLAWCIDEYCEHDDDRVHTGGTLALRDPLLLEFNEREATGIKPFSRWVVEHPCGVINRLPTQERRHPAKELAYRWAVAAPRGGSVPLPIILDVAEIDRLLTGWVSSGDVPSVVEPWCEWPGSRVVFVIDDDGPVDAVGAARLLDRGFRTLIITPRYTAWTEALGWPGTVVMAVLDPLSSGLGPSQAALRALVDLLLHLFDRGSLQRFAGTVIGAQAGEVIQIEDIPHTAALADHVVDLLVRHGRIETPLFDHLLALRPRSRADIERVLQMFVDLGRHAEP